MHWTLCLAAAALLGAADDPTRTQPSPATDAKGVEKIKELIKQLGDDSYAVREKASAALVALGQPALPLLREATKDSDLEIVRRAQACIERIGPTAEEAAAAERSRRLQSAQMAGRYAAQMDAMRRARQLEPWKRR
jgi:hypothetical protein